jgi:recombinational DNA repair protein RecR
MPDFAAPVHRLIDELKRLPGVGQKTAPRLASQLNSFDSPARETVISKSVRDAEHVLRNHQQPAFRTEDLVSVQSQ